MIYETHLRATEENAWPLDTTIAWDAIDLDIARGEHELHRSLHDAALIEGYLPVYAARLMQMLWDDVDATAVLSMELYEGLKHFTALARYLDRFREFCVPRETENILHSATNKLNASQVNA